MRAGFFDDLFGEVALLAGRRKFDGENAAGESRGNSPSTAGRAALILAFTSGFAILALEVIWFRLLKIAWLNTTDAFAVMLMAFLLALFLGARLSRWKPAAGNPAAFLFAGASRSQDTVDPLGALVFWDSAVCLVLATGFRED